MTRDEQARLDRHLDDMMSGQMWFERYSNAKDVPEQAAKAATKRDQARERIYTMFNKALDHQ